MKTIEDLELIGKLCGGAAMENIDCCDDPSFETYYREQHFYESPKPALCTCYRSEVSVCRRIAPHGSCTCPPPSGRTRMSNAASG